MKDEERFGVSVHTGFPNPAIDQRLQALDFNKLLIKNTVSTFMFRIRGNDWEGAGVFDGDIAVVDRALHARKNDVVIWWREADSQFAISHLHDMPDGASLWGVVTATIHQFRTT
ncbi:MAG TPA: S24 family peptidase [Candidatus Saccharimonadales bacterium]|nr:S24 family peptidase [Candidatus Saccharimonadales bacterium]